MKDSRRSVSDLLRERGLRVTPQRRAVWQAFADGRAGHLPADEVLRRARRALPEISRATVYNALGDLVQAGLLRTAPGRNALLFEANSGTHDHFHCRVCQRLYDVRSSGVDAIRLDTPGFRVEREQVLFEGACPSCAKAA